MRRLNDREEEIMNIFWKLKKAFVKEVLPEIKDPAPPYNTFLSAVRKLEQEGFLSYKTFGKSNQYFPKISKSAYRKSILGSVVTNFFGGSKEELLSFFLKEEKLSKEEVKEILNQIEKLKND